MEVSGPSGLMVKPSLSTNLRPRSFRKLVYPVVEFVGGQQTLVAQSRHRRSQVRQGTQKEPDGGMLVGLVKRYLGYTLDLGGV